MPMSSRYKTSSYPSIFNCLVSGAVLMVMISVLSWLILLLALYGMHFYASNVQIDNQLSLLIEKTQGFISDSNVVLGKHLLLFSNQIQTHIQNGSVWVMDGIHQLMLSYQVDAEKWHIDNISLFLKNIWQSVFVIVLRLFSLTLFLPLLAMVSLLCVIDGLVVRDIRKFQAAMESTFFHHRIKRAFKSSLVFLLFIYLAFPLYVSPWMNAILMLAMSGLWIHVACGSFKKYV